MKPKPHIKQYCCCTWQGHPWLAISTVVAAENSSKDDVVSCRVCFVLGDIVGRMCGTQCDEAPRNRCFTLGLWFHVGFRADFMMFFMLVRVGFMSVMLGALKFIALKTAERHSAKHVVSCRVGVSCRVCGCPNLHGHRAFMNLWQGPVTVPTTQAGLRR